MTRIDRSCRRPNLGGTPETVLSCRHRFRGLVNGESLKIHHQVEGANPVNRLVCGILFRVISLKSRRLELRNVRGVCLVKFRIIRFKPLRVEPTPPVSRQPSGYAIDPLRGTDRQLAVGRAEPARQRRQQDPRGPRARHVPGDDLPPHPRIRHRHPGRLTSPRGGEVVGASGLEPWPLSDGPSARPLGDGPPVGRAGFCPRDGAPLRPAGG